MTAAAASKMTVTGHCGLAGWGVVVVLIFVVEFELMMMRLRRFLKAAAQARYAVESGNDEEPQLNAIEVQAFEASEERKVTRQMRQKRSR